MCQQKFARQGELIELEDEDFEFYFAAYGEDQVASRYVLTPALIQALLEMRRELQIPFFASFVGSSMYFAIEPSEDPFDVEWWMPLNSYKALFSHYQYLRIPEYVVAKLALDTRIWGV